MRALIIMFFLGFSISIVLDDWLIEQYGDLNIGDLLVRPSIEFNHDVIEDALEPQSGEDAEPLEDVPDADWYNKATPPIRPA